MFADDNVRVVSLDTGTRVKGVCQLMDGVIFSIHLTGTISDDDIALLVQQFNYALQRLNRYILRADLFLEKHRDLNKINNKELREYQRVVKKKRREIIKLLGKEYEALGLPEFEDFCQRADFE
jgi:hypothetical protein